MDIDQRAGSKPPALRLTFNKNTNKKFINKTNYNGLSIYSSIYILALLS